MTRLSLLTILATLALSGCWVGVREDLDAKSAGSRVAELQAESAKPLDSYYTYRRDPRRCASPTCGGYWISLLNRERTLCADGSRARECYAAAIELPPGQSAEVRGIAHGELRLQSYSGQTQQFGVLAADAAFTAILDVDAEGAVYALVQDTGVRCITVPCPSIQVALLNRKSANLAADLGFDASNDQDRSALESAFLRALADPTAIGAGAIVVGRQRLQYNRNKHSWTRLLTIANVYVTAPSTGSNCLVQVDDAQASAWNFAGIAEAQQLADTLTGDIELLEGRCSEITDTCTLDYAPVRGEIDALGTACFGTSNVCQFRAAIIRAAGVDSKASGHWSSGVCPRPGDACQSDADCTDGFCGWNSQGNRVCRPWSREGGSCLNTVTPEYQTRCAPDLECQPGGDPMQPGGSNGTCVKPR